ncbi:hypothetical protein XENOCAPTIV_005152, partial [Xenoophorus captivus]
QVKGYNSLLGDFAVGVVVDLFPFVFLADWHSQKYEREWRDDHDEVSSVKSEGAPFRGGFRAKFKLNKAYSLNGRTHFPSNEEALSPVSHSEYYFSMDNLERDFFLRRKMDQEGFLPIGLIASFHRVQALTTDINLILEVNKNFTEMCNFLIISL